MKYIYIYIIRLKIINLKNVFFIFIYKLILITMRYYNYAGVIFVSNNC